MHGKRAVLLMFCMLVLAQASFANHNGYGGSYYGDSSYDRSYGGNAFRGFNINFDTHESIGSGFSTTTRSGFREGDSYFYRDGSFGNDNQGSHSVDQSYFDQYSDTIDHEYSYDNKDTRTWGNYYGGSNNYYMNDYHTSYPSYGNYGYGGGYYDPSYGSGYGGNYRSYGNTNSGRMMGYYNGGRVYV